MPASTLAPLKKHLRPGGVYRRTDLLRWSNSVDRHLKKLIADGTLQKLHRGLYYHPRNFDFGDAPADENTLLKAFLGTNRFVVVSPNAYNQLGVGTTQLYDKRIVYNQQRNRTLMLGNRMFTFKRRSKIPRQISAEFLVVDLVNELAQLAEDQDAILSRVRERAKTMDRRKLSRAISLYGKTLTQRWFKRILEHS